MTPPGRSLPHPTFRRLRHSRFARETTSAQPVQKTKRRVLWVNRDISYRRSIRLSLRRWFAPLAAGLLLAALSLSALRNHLIALRYEVAAERARERSLAHSAQKLRVEVGRLRHPARLRSLALDMELGPAPQLWLEPVPAPGETIHP